MKNFHLQITTPDGLVFDNEAHQLSVRAIDGDVAILAGHIPYVTALKDGGCRVYVDDEIRHASCSSGLLCVTKDVVRLISSDFEWNDK